MNHDETKMDVRKSLIQTGKAILVLVVFLFAFAIYLIFQHGFRQFSEIYLTRYVAEAVIMLVVLSLVFFFVDLLDRK